MRGVDSCIRQLRILYGLPPHDGGSNICRGDGYFAKSIERDYPPEVVVEARKVFKKEQAAWERARQRHIKRYEPAAATEKV